MNEIINQLAHGGAFILAAIGFLIFFLTQIWKAVHVDKSYGEKLITVKQPRNEWLTLIFILAVGIVVIIRLFTEKNTPTAYGSGDSHRRPVVFPGSSNHQPDKDFYEWYSRT